MLIVEIYGSLNKYNTFITDEDLKSAQMRKFTSLINKCERLMGSVEEGALVDVEQGELVMVDVLSILILLITRIPMEATMGLLEGTYNLWRMVSLRSLKDVADTVLGEVTITMEMPLMVNTQGGCLSATAEYCYYNGYRPARGVVLRRTSTLLPTRTLPCLFWCQQAWI